MNSVTLSKGRFWAQALDLYTGSVLGQFILYAGVFFGATSFALFADLYLGFPPTRVVWLTIGVATFLVFVVPATYVHIFRFVSSNVLYHVNRVQSIADHAWLRHAFDRMVITTGEGLARAYGKVAELESRGLEVQKVELQVQELCVHVPDAQGPNETLDIFVEAKARVDEWEAENYPALLKGHVTREKGLSPFDLNSEGEGPTVPRLYDIWQAQEEPDHNKLVATFLSLKAELDDPRISADTRAMLDRLISIAWTTYNKHLAQGHRLSLLMGETLHNTEFKNGMIVVTMSLFEEIKKIIHLRQPPSKSSIFDSKGEKYYYRKNE